MIVAYYRVSTDKQGASGLGLEAQQDAVKRFASGNDIVAEFTEVESGKNCARPELAKALARAKADGATLVIAKIDRLARNAHFVTGLLESGVDIRAADMPEADRTMMQIMAVFAEHEGRMISERTKAGLAAAKRRGVRLGSPVPSRGGIATKTASVERAVAIRSRVAAIVKPLREANAPLSTIAASLNGAGVEAPRGGRWSRGNLGHYLNRYLEQVI